MKKEYISKYFVAPSNVFAAQITEEIFEKIKGIIFRGLRSSHRRCSVKKGVLKNFAELTGKHLCWCLFLIKLQALRLQKAAFKAYLGPCQKNFVEFFCDIS